MFTSTYYITMDHTPTKLMMDWANYKRTSKHATAREHRFRARHRKYTLH